MLVIRFLLFVFCCFSAIISNAQVEQLFRVNDAYDHAMLAGVLLYANDSIVGVSDIDGNVRVKLKRGEYSFRFVSVGYDEFAKQLVIPTNQSEAILMQPSTTELNVLVVSGTKYIKPIDKMAVSMEVVKAEDLTRKITPSLSDAVERISGVTILDGQASIRGGSSYAFGAGSRVLLVVDDMPLMSGDRNDIKWNFVPLEMVDQIELTKGAASVSYGASALNGIIQVRTAYPEGKTWTRASAFQMVYPEPAVGVSKWWGKSTPYQSSISAAHAFTTDKGLDVVIGANVLDGRGFLNGENERRARISFKTRKFFRDGKISAGLDGNILFKRQGLFLFWANDSTSAYLPFSTSTNVSTTDLWTSIDPWVKWTDRFDNRHSVKGRYYMTSQPYNFRMQPIAHNITLDYQVKRQLPFDIAASGGVSATQTIFFDSSIGGTHMGNLAGVFVQLQRSWKRLELQAGWRYELYRIDTIFTPAVPVQSYGLNFEINPKTHLRASYGEGFRFPSGIERFLKYNIDILYVYPNPTLKPERGWNYEVGVKHRMNVGKWSAFADLALFYTKYKNMTEFYFSQYGVVTDPLFGFGFSSVNVTNARVIGAETTLNAEGKLGRMKLIIHGGYTYACPVDASLNPELQSFGKLVNYAVETFNTIESNANSAVLKYRYRHLVKCNLDIEHDNGITAGVGLRTYSYMERVDSVFTFFIPGLDHYRATNKHGSAIVDLRFGYTINDQHRIVLHCTNLFNRFVAVRPAKPEAPRGIGFQYTWSF
jgi:iron complex outermembrane receptor protein